MSTRRSAGWFLLFTAYLATTSLILVSPPWAELPGIYALALLGGFLAMLVPPALVCLKLVGAQKAAWGRNLLKAERPLSHSSMLISIGLLGFTHLLDGALLAVGLGAAAGVMEIAGGMIMGVGLAWSYWIMLRAIPEAAEETPVV